MRGIGYDADGRAHRLVVGEQSILGILFNDYFADPAFLNQGELTAAAEALRSGDAAPLLRLAAESPAPSDFGDPAGFFNVGSTYAVYCADTPHPWDPSAPEAAREARYAAAFATVPPGATAPFSVAAWTGYMASQPVEIIPGVDACVPWPAPARLDPPFPAGQPFPASVPALLMGGQLDYVGIDSERRLLPLFPSGRFVEVASAGHPTTDWSDCAYHIMLGFLDTLRIGDTSCARDAAGSLKDVITPATGLYQLQGVGRFARLFAKAAPARVDPAGGDRSSPLDRRLAAAAGPAWRTPSTGSRA